MNFRLIICGVLLLLGCGRNNDNKKPKEIRNDKIEAVSILISRGGGGIVQGDVPEGSIIPDSLSSLVDEMYFLELNSTGLLKTTHGYGRISSTGPSGNDDLKMNQIESIDSTIIAGSKLKRILEWSRNILPEKQYWTDRSPTDSWLVKLKINDKTSVYYMNESGNGEPYHLDKDYRDIVDKMVTGSSIKVKDYR